MNSNLLKKIAVKVCIAYFSSHEHFWISDITVTHLSIHRCTFIDTHHTSLSHGFRKPQNATTSIFKFLFFSQIPFWSQNKQSNYSKDVLIVHWSVQYRWRRSILRYILRSAGQRDGLWQGIGLRHLRRRGIDTSIWIVYT